MLKKICINCEKEYSSLDVSKCEKCGENVYLYLTEDNGFSKLKSTFSKNKEEETRLVGKLEDLSKWKDFFNNLEDSHSKDFFKDAKDFKDHLDDFDFPDTIIIENDIYKQDLRNFHKAVEVILAIEELTDKVKAYNLNYNVILKNLNDPLLDDGIKKSYIAEISQKLDEITDFEYLDSYDESLGSYIDEINSIEKLFGEINLELDEINSLRPYFGEYKKYFAGFSDKPNNHDEFKEKIYSLKHLDIFTNEDVKNLKSTFKQIDNETIKVNELNDQIPKLYYDFDNLIEGIVDDYTKHQFLDKYSDLKADLFSFKHLKLLEDVGEVKKAQKFFNNFDDEWDLLVSKKAELDKEANFKQALNEFNNKWSDFNLQLDERELFKHLGQFKQDLNNIKGEYSEFIVDGLFTDYGPIFDYMAEVDKKIESFDFSNFKVSVLLNYLKDTSITAVSKVERVNHYKNMLNRLNSTDLEALKLYNPFLEIPYKDIEEIETLFKSVNDEISDVESLKTIIDDYNDSSKLPTDIKEFENKLSAFKYLDMIPYFDPSLENHVDVLLEIKNILKQVAIEINAVSALILDCSRCKLEYEKVQNKKMDLDEFLDKYSQLNEKIFSFDHMELWPYFDENLKDYGKLVIEVQEIFRNPQ